MQIIQMSDLYGQYLTMKGDIDAAIEDVIKSAQFIKSKKVTEFEEKLSAYLNTNVITCGNGTDALQIAFMALNLATENEVITTPFTFVSTVEVLVLLGLKPVFVDVSLDNFNIDSPKIESAITDRTKAILPVHLFGQSADLEVIMKLSEKYNLNVIEDACQALGTNFLFRDGTIKKAGTVGNIGCNSFFPSKNLGAFGDGGAVYTNDKELAEVIRSIANHGRKEMYVYERAGINSRLDGIQAAVLEVKLKYIEKHVKARQEAAFFYDKHLGEIEEIRTPMQVEYSTHTFHQYTIRTDKRNDLQAFLKRKGIPSMIYYPHPIHLQEAYRFLGYKKGDFPNSEKLADTVLSLPMHTELTEEQLKYITNSIKNFYSNKNG